MAFNALTAFGARLSKLLVEMELAVGFIVVFVELIAFEGFAAFRADEMVRMP